MQYRDYKLTIRIKRVDAEHAKVVQTPRRLRDRNDRTTQQRVPKFCRERRLGLDGSTGDPALNKGEAVASPSKSTTSGGCARGGDEMNNIVARFATLRGRGWMHNENNNLRCAKGYCPIIALADQEGGVGFERELDSNMPWASITVRLNSGYRRIGQDLGLSDRMINAIVSIADGMSLDSTVLNYNVDPYDAEILKDIFEMLQ